MYARDFRATARQKMQGHWGTYAIITLLYILITCAFSALLGLIFPMGTVEKVNQTNILINSISLCAFSLIVTGPFTMSFAKTSLKLYNNKNIFVKDLFSGFGAIGKVLPLYLTNAILIFLWSLLLIVPGIIKTLSYALSFYILAEKPEIGVNEARKQSMQMMNGHKWQLFCLMFSFIGWLILSVLTFGILLLWIQPYMETAIVSFYKKLKEEQ